MITQIIQRSSPRLPSGKSSWRGACALDLVRDWSLDSNHIRFSESRYTMRCTTRHRIRSWPLSHRASGGVTSDYTRNRGSDIDAGSRVRSWTRMPKATGTPGGGAVLTSTDPHTAITTTLRDPQRRDDQHPPRPPEPSHTCRTSGILKTVTRTAPSDARSIPFRIAACTPTRQRERRE